MSFKLEDLKHDFFDKVVFLQYNHSTGIGGPGAVFMITENGEEYMLGLLGFEYSESELDKFIPILTKGERSDPIDYRTCFLVEDKGWKYVYSHGDVLIHNDYYEKISEDYVKCKEKDEYNSWHESAKRVLDPSDKFPRKVYEGTEALLKKQKENEEADEQRRALVRLTEDDLDWKDLYIYNQKFKGAWLEGTYLLLFKKNEDGSISGSKWTIEFQREEFKPCGQKMNAPIEMYNLYYKSYRNMAGILRYKEPNEQCSSCYKCSTLDDGVGSYGKFVRSFKTLESAKEGALYRNEHSWGNCDKDNLLRFDWGKMNIADVEKEYNEKIIKENAYKKKLKLLFVENCQDLYTILAEHDYARSAIDDIADKLHITREDVYIMLHITPSMFCKKMDE